MIDIGDHAVDHLAQIVGRDIRRKSHRNARRAVYEKVGETPGEHIRLFERIVEVERKGNGVLIEIAQQFERERLQTRLRVAHGGGGVAVHRAEVAVSVDERAPHVEILRHAHHGVVHRGVAVRVIFTHAVADDTRRLLMRLVGRKPHLVHGIENAPLNGFQTVLHAGKGAVENDELRIREHCGRQDLFERRYEQVPLRFFLLLFLTLHRRPPS